MARGGPRCFPGPSGPARRRWRPRSSAAASRSRTPPCGPSSAGSPACRRPIWSSARRTTAGRTSLGRPIDFNLSHSAEWALIGVAPPGLRVGVDVERVRGDLDHLAMARHLYQPAEVDHLTRAASPGGVLPALVRQGGVHQGDRGGPGRPAGRAGNAGRERDGGFVAFPSLDRRGARLRGRRRHDRCHDRWDTGTTYRLNTRSRSTSSPPSTIDTYRTSRSSLPITASWV